MLIDTKREQEILSMIREADAVFIVAPKKDGAFTQIAFMGDMPDATYFGAIDLAKARKLHARVIAQGTDV